MCGEQCRSAMLTSASIGSPPRVRGTDNPGSQQRDTPGITPACAGNRYAGISALDAGWDHPRVCGEQVHCNKPYPADGGSPPRVRGTVGQCGILFPRLRITPACAGNSRRRIKRCNRAGDHPRVCGEQVSPFRQLIFTRGSPPRVRGTADWGYTADERIGITPACAGNSTSSPGPWAPQRDHPRVCGEQSANQPTPFVDQGSPPRVRGTGRDQP